MNASGLKQAIDDCKGGVDGFLLNQLFDVEALSIDDMSEVSEETRSSRACFNDNHDRNLEKFLKLIVRFATPEPRETFRLYQVAVGRVIEDGEHISDILREPLFSLANGELAHDQFWRILVSRSYDFVAKTANDAIDTLVEYLPSYSSLDTEARGLRARSVYSLVLLLDHAGWGRTSGKRRNNSSENVVEIAKRIYGEGEYGRAGLIERLAAEDRGVLGWYDLFIFRLQCNADRQGQVFNVTSALIVHDDMNAPTSGDTRALAIAGMRTLSQRIFARFHEQYIKPSRNYLAAVDETPESPFFGTAEAHFKKIAAQGSTEERLQQRLLGTKSLTRPLLSTSLPNPKPANGKWCGLWYYDPEGIADRDGISSVMNKYLFEVCFNPELDAKNARRFVDYCLCNLVIGIWGGADDEGYMPTAASLADELDARELVAYWGKFAVSIKQMDLTSLDKKVFTLNYIADYATDLPRVYAVLDTMLAAGSSAQQNEAE